MRRRAVLRRTGTVCALACASIALACASSTPAPSPAPAPYVFGWPFLDAPMEPRGGTTRGGEVTLATEPSDGWHALRAAPEGRARDRAAILAMAGDYRVSFDFLETVLFEPGAKPARPYRSWGTERVYVLEAGDDFVSLQHVLVMFVVDDDGTRQGPFVQKHWRQDWRYEPETLLGFEGRGRFALRQVPAEARRGAWSQTVYQVDDAPRYASVGRWRHADEASVWEGDRAWRPLPRREHSVRDDYQVLAGRNRLTVLPDAWVHEHDNLKLVLDGDATRSLAREIGLSRYERIRDFDFRAADAYWDATSSFWSRVRDGWARRATRLGRFRVAKRCDGEEAFVPWFRYAGRLEAGEDPPPEAQRAEVDRILDCLVSAD